MRDLLVKLATSVAAATMLVTGVWARLDPASFARWANWPNHVHFLHDAGVFQIGIGLMMLCAFWWRDVLAVVLAGFVFTNTFHAVNHALDRHLGGHDSDWWTLALVSVLGAIALAARLRALNKQSKQGNLGTQGNLSSLAKQSGLGNLDKQGNLSSLGKQGGLGEVGGRERA
ncbi:hypothetical protein ACIBHX_00560 [Nonomuraea sp. NPDC050536]|uniref:hypothetical protein n=1 Tax=Nonomuraea sp. NPDC050536 TaxID=3364366 RepID=UPI0037CC7009